MSGDRDAMTLLSLEAVGVAYAGMRALSGVTVSLRAGEILGISGPNGAGKTSLLRVIAGLTPLDSGKVSLGDVVLADASCGARLSVRRIVRLGITLVPEGRRLFAGLSVEDHLRFGAYLAGVKEVETSLQRVYATFPKLADRRRQDVVSLSGGEKQMVAIGRALMAAPRLLMIDELSLGLAPVVVNEIIDTLTALNASTGLTIILVDECLGRLGNAVSKVLFLSHGRIQAIKAPDDVRREAASLYLHAGSD